MDILQEFYDYIHDLIRKAFLIFRRTIIFVILTIVANYVVPPVFGVSSKDLATRAVVVALGICSIVSLVLDLRAIMRGKRR